MVLGIPPPYNNNAYNNSFIKKMLTAMQKHN